MDVFVEHSCDALSNAERVHVHTSAIKEETKSIDVWSVITHDMMQ